MNVIFAASLFDSPWMVAALIVGSALVNWLSKRRQEKQAGKPSGNDEPPPRSDQPSGEISLEETLRRLMGEDPLAPQTAPPPIPDWEEEAPFQPARETVPALRPPPIAMPHAGITTTAAREHLEQAVRRFEQLNELGRHPATVVRHGRGHRLPGSRRVASRWRDPQSARRAFVASIVFAPPKSLEP